MRFLGGRIARMAMGSQRPGEEERKKGEENVQSKRNVEGWDANSGRRHAGV